jgi:hypothetical protein
VIFMGENFNERLNGTTISDTIITGGSIDNTPIGQTIPSAGSFSLLRILNNVWTQALNYAGSSYLNLFKLNEDNEIEIGTTLILGSSIEAAEDSGAITLTDMPVSATPAAGDEMSFTQKIGGTNILKVYAEADSFGGIQNPRVDLATNVGLRINTITAYADNAAAVAGGLEVGDLYRIGDTLAIVHA